MDVPGHVAAIQDGNRRYAESRGQEPYKGHQKGVETTRAFLRWTREIGVEEVTIYALSTENLDRDDEELRALFDLLESELLRAARDEEVHESGTRIRCLGDEELLPGSLREAIEVVEGATADNGDRFLNVAIGYGGRLDLLQAVRSLARDVENRGGAGDLEGELRGRLLPEAGEVSDVDLLIRTGGEKRISNFLPWQTVGNGCRVYFSDKMWPEFSKRDFSEALEVYGLGEPALLLALRPGRATSRIDGSSDRTPRRPL